MFLWHTNANRGTVGKMITTAEQCTLHCSELSPVFTMPIFRILTENRDGYWFYDVDCRDGETLAFHCKQFLLDTLLVDDYRSLQASYHIINNMPIMCQIIYYEFLIISCDTIG